MEDGVVDDVIKRLLGAKNGKTTKQVQLTDVQIFLRGFAIVQAVTHYSDPEMLVEVSCGLGEAMAGINLNDDKEDASMES